MSFIVRYGSRFRAFEQDAYTYQRLLCFLVYNGTRYLLPGGGLVPVAARANAVDVFSVAARDTRGVRRRLRSVAGAKRDDSRERLFTEIKSFEATYKTSGARLLDRHRHDRLRSLLVALLLRESARDDQGSGFALSRGQQS